MNTTLAYLRGRRAWLVENLTVWGSDGETNIFLAAAETVSAEKRIGFWQVNLGPDHQVMDFAGLSDNRGNNLPAVIKKPAIMVMPRGANAAFIKTVQGDTGFTIVKNESEGPAVVVDLMIFETGL